MRPKIPLLEIKAVGNWNKIVYSVRNRKKLYREHIPYEDGLDYNLLSKKQTIDYFSQDLTKLYEGEQKTLIQENFKMTKPQNPEIYQNSKLGFDTNINEPAFKFGKSIITIGGAHTSTRNAFISTDNPKNVKTKGITMMDPDVYKDLFEEVFFGYDFNIGLLKQIFCYKFNEHYNMLIFDFKSSCIKVILVKIQK
jgi:hypothetical protein